MTTILLVSYNELHIIWGGIHRVNKLLMDGFASQGYNCLYLINKEGQYFYINNKEIEENKIDREGLKRYLIDQNINVIIDQEGIFSDSFCLTFKTLGLTNIKLLTVFHNTPAIYERLYDKAWLRTQIIGKKGVIPKLSYLARYVCYPWWKKSVFKKSAMRYQIIYDNSDRCVLLSNNDMPTLRQYVPQLSVNKCVAISNALTFDTTSDETILQKKEKIVLIVARLNDDEKRISLALKIWKILQNRGVPDWSLTIVGTGPHEGKLKELSMRLKLNNVSFEGRQQSEPFYEKAALFMMTSAVEGWGLTLTESMQRGVVPLVFDSYPALGDIITNNYDGCVIPDNDLIAYADRMQQLMQNKDEREQIAKNALDSCQRFAPEKVVKQWIDLIESL